MLYKLLIRPMMVTHAPNGGPPPAPTSRGCRCYNPSVFALLRVRPGTFVVGIFTRIYSPTTSQP